METFECCHCSDAEQELQWVPHSVTVFSLACCCAGLTAAARPDGATAAALVLPMHAWLVPHRQHLRRLLQQSEGLNVGVASLRELQLLQSSDTPKANVIDLRTRSDSRKRTNFGSDTGGFELFLSEAYAILRVSLRLQV